MADINNSVKGLRDADIVIPNLCSSAQKDLKDDSDYHASSGQEWTSTCHSRHGLLTRTSSFSPWNPLCHHWLQRLASTKQKHQKQAAHKDGSHASFSVLPLDHTYSLAIFHHLVCKNSDILQSSRISQQLRTLTASYWEFLKTQQLSSMPHKTHAPGSKRHKA